MVKFLTVYSIIVTICFCFTFWLVVRTNKDGSSAARRAEDELRKSRETVGRIRTELTDCRRVLTDSNEGLAGVIERLRVIAEKVEDMENIIDGGSTS